MSKHEKALQRIVSKPSDYKWNELVSLMLSLSYLLEKSSGSGRKFIHPETESTLFIHEPHPSKVLKSYQVRDAIYFLKEEGILK